MKLHLSDVLPVCLLSVVAAGCAQPAPEPEVALTEQTSQRAVPDIVQKMVEAHGGLSKWRNAPTVSFEDALELAGAEAPLVSRVMVEQGRRRIDTEYPQMGMRLVWDGEMAWSVNWQLPMPPRFLSSLNYYFVNLPWLAFDPGVNLEERGGAGYSTTPPSTSRSG
jgi:hypothetical protein